MARASGSRATLARKLRPRSSIGYAGQEYSRTMIGICGMMTNRQRQDGTESGAPCHRFSLAGFDLLIPGRKQRRREVRRGAAAARLGRKIRMRIGVRFDGAAIEM